MRNNELTSNAFSHRRMVPLWAVVALTLSWALVSVAAAGDTKPDRKRERQVRIEIPEQGAFFGITMQELDDAVREGLDTSAKHGVLVTEVIDDSPAEKAGIENGDIIVEFEGKRVESADELRKLIGEESVGDKVSVKLVRGKESKTFDVTLGDWADQPTMVWYGGPDDEFAWHHLKGFANAMVWPHRLGVRVSELNEDLGSYFGVKGGEGVLVLDVEENSTGEAVGLKGGDVIVKVEGEAVTSAEQMRERLSDVDPGDEVSVTVVRNKKTIDLKGEMKEGEGAGLLRAPGMRMHYAPAPNDDLRRELDQLRKEIDELKKELKKS